MTNEPREAYSEIAALIASLAKTFGLSDAAAAAAVESGAIALQFSQDETGNRFVVATYAGQTARIYKGAIKHADDHASEARKT